MKIREGAQEDWDTTVRVNQDFYGSCAIRFVERWANLMEERMARGEELEAIAEKTSYEANTEGITAYQYGWSVACLAHVWEYGERLRRWHNLYMQISDEGERANAEGRTLNPALLNYRERK